MTSTNIPTPRTDAVRLTIAAGDWNKESDTIKYALDHADQLERELTLAHADVAAMREELDKVERKSSEKLRFPSDENETSLLAQEINRIATHALLSTTTGKELLERHALDVELKEKWRTDLETALEQLAAEKLRADRAEAELHEAQQWLDSEPDWKNKFMANYSRLESNLTALQKVAKELAEACTDGENEKAITDYANLPPEVKGTI